MDKATVFNKVKGLLLLLAKRPMQLTNATSSSRFLDRFPSQFCLTHRYCFGI